MKLTAITIAFRELRKHGYFARQNHLCCATCGWNAVPDNFTDRAVFYHNQDAHDLKDIGWCYLSWAGNSEEILLILQKHGLQPELDSPDHRIKITLPSKKV
jgi:hypothetical protein